MRFFTHDDSVYGYILASRILRRMSTHTFIPMGYYILARLVGWRKLTEAGGSWRKLTEAGGSWRKLTEVLKIDKNDQNSMRN